MAVAMRYGSNRTASGGTSGPSAIIYKGTIDDESTVILTPEAGGLYELFTAEYNASTGAYRGHRSRLIKAPEEDAYGTTASQTINESASTNSGVTITMNSDSTISLARSSATYAVKYVLRAVGTNIGNVSSAVTDAEAARDQAQASATAAAASATAAASSETAAAAAIEHYPKIENGYWYVWDVQTGAWTNTGVEAQGETGATPNLTIGTVTTGAPGSSASASITGTPENPVLNMSIPRGDPGVSGGLAMTILWTNPSPTASFAAQTVALDLSSYQAVIVFCRDFAVTDAQSAFVSTMIIKGTTGACLMASRSSSSSGKRMATVSDTGIDFAYNGYNGSSDNARNVPIYIYGVKGIT